MLVYRSVLPENLTEDSARELVESNNWYHGGTFKHYPTAHFHSNTHECYAALRGSTKCLYGVGPLDDGSDSVSFDMKAGDIAVHAAGVAHRNVRQSVDAPVYTVRVEFQPTRSHPFLLWITLLSFLPVFC